jgi:hypothetical protein
VCTRNCVCEGEGCVPCTVDVKGRGVYTALCKLT